MTGTRARTMTETLKEIMHFAAIFLTALAACTCLRMEKSAGAESCSYEARVSCDLRALRDAMELYKMDAGKWPDSMRDLMECPSSLEGWAGPYLRRYPVDPWDEEYVLFKKRGGIRVGTFGADSLPGGEEDYFIDIESETIYCTRTEVSTGVPGFIKWGWLLSTTAALAIAVLLWREIRISRKHS